MWQRHSLLLKLSGQTQLLEELAEISVDRLGAITSAADGESHHTSLCPLSRLSRMRGSFFFQCSDPGFYVSHFLAVLPGLAERPQLMTLWSECSGSAGLFHTTLDRVFQHMRQHYTAVLQERHPHSADEGYIIVFHFFANKAKVTSNKSLSCFSSTVFIPCWFSCCFS